jgi:hypothetical protein
MARVKTRTTGVKTSGDAPVQGHTLKEVANAVKKNPATIVRWIEQGKVPVKKRKNASGHYFFTEADLQALKTYSKSIRIIGP